MPARPARRKHEGREDACGEKPPSQARRSQLAAGHGGPSGGLLGPEMEGPRVRALKSSYEKREGVRGASRGARGPRGRSLGLASKRPKVRGRKSSHEERQGFHGEKAPSQAQMSPLAAGREGPAAEASASQRRDRKREVERALHKGREGVRGEKPPGQACRSQLAAGKTGPRGGRRGLASKGLKEGARKASMKDAEVSA